MGTFQPIRRKFVEYTPWLHTPQQSLVAAMRLRDVFAMNLRRARNAANLTQEELADRAGIDRSYVSELEGAKYAATLDIIEALAAALEVEPTSLLARSAASHLSP